MTKEKKPTAPRDWASLIAGAGMSTPMFMNDSMQVVGNPETGMICIIINASPAAEASAPLSKSGKARLLASTKGNQRIACAGRAITLGLNVYVPAARR